MTLSKLITYIRAQIKQSTTLQQPLNNTALCTAVYNCTWNLTVLPGSVASGSSRVALW